MSAADTFQQAVAHDLAADIAAAFRLYQKSAASGHPIACYNLGVCLEQGDGTQKDMALATHFYGLSAKAGYAPAQVRMALLQTDPAARRRLLQAAADQQYEVALILLEQAQDYQTTTPPSPTI